jgi:hypothetical protein
MRLPMAEQPESFEIVKGRISEASARAAEVVATALSACRPRIVFNMGVRAEEAAVAESIGGTLRENLGIEPDFFGFVFQDPNVQEASRRRVPFLPHFPGSAAVEGISKLGERVEKFWGRPVEGSAALMARHVFRVAEARVKNEPAAAKPTLRGRLDSFAARTREALRLRT